MLSFPGGHNFGTNLYIDIKYVDYGGRTSLEGHCPNSRDIAKI